MSGFFIGLDLGTSAVKAVLTDDAGVVRASASAPLTVSRPHPRWSEQDPEDWWRAADMAMRVLRQEAGDTAFQAVRGLGLSGQMHGATLLGADHRILRPAMLWNDTRADTECHALETAVTDTPTRTGTLSMPSFTAPKLLWVRTHEPNVFDKTQLVVLPKDYLRLRMTGEAATDCSDASGTQWLDVGARQWSAPLLTACGLDEAHMPHLFEGPAATGTLRDRVAQDWGLARIPVAAGGGDNAAGAVGLGLTGPERGFLSLGTSGVLFVPAPGFAPRPETAIHSFAHALPGLWHHMAVSLSAAASLSWAVSALGAADEATLLAEAQSVQPAAPRGLFFLPYLSGERTPHNDAFARGVFFGLDGAMTRGDLARAVLEGVAFALRDGRDAIASAGVLPERLFLIGGGARSRFWAQILADTLALPLDLPESGETGPALGAARLGRLAATGEPVADACPPARAMHSVEPGEIEPMATGHATFAALYRSLAPHFHTTQSG